MVVHIMNAPNGQDGFDALFAFQNRRGIDPLRRRGGAFSYHDVNAGTGMGNYLLTVPLLTLPGRNGNLTSNLYHNSNVWRQTASNVLFDPDHGWPAPGWSLGFGQALWIVETVSDGQQSHSWVRDADGTLHSLSGGGHFLPFGSGTWPTLITVDGSLIDCFSISQAP